ncbi:MAG: nucleotidyltransferase domain-containing protein [bacterium]
MPCQPPILLLHQHELLEFLIKKEEILFAYLFGSYASGLQGEMSDVDIAIYFTASPGLMELGMLTSQLEKILACDVDIIVLNGLEKRDPGLAYTIVIGGISLFTRDTKILYEYRHTTLLRYLDAAPLFSLLDRTLSERLAQGTYGTFHNA